MMSGAAPAGGSDDKNDGKDLDTITEELLELVDRYEELVNDQLRVNFVDGYLSLSRANFSNHRNFGPNDYDLSGNKACKVVDAGEEFVLRDLLEEERKEKEREEKEQREVQTTTEKVDLDTAVTSSVAPRAGPAKMSSSTHEFETSTLKDPIRQFGGIIPYQLRDSQSCFNKGLANAVGAVNLQNRIKKLVSAIETLSTPRDSILAE